MIEADELFRRIERIGKALYQEETTRCHVCYGTRQVIVEGNVRVCPNCCGRGVIFSEEGRKIVRELQDIVTKLI